MKICFLDIDGVMNSAQFSLAQNRDWIRRMAKYSASKSMKKGPKPTQSIYSWDPVTVSNLQFIIEKVPDLKIVVSSTWRKYFKTEGMKEHFEKNHLDPELIIGCTPSLPQEHLFRSVDRGLEIQAWIDEWNKDKPDKIKEEDLVILDDDSDMAHLKHRLIQTDGATGLTIRDANKAVQMLGVKIPILVWR